MTSKCVGIVGCVVVTFLSSIVVLIPNDSFFSFAAIVFTERVVSCL